MGDRLPEAAGAARAPVRRVVVLGPPGSGKTTLACLIGQGFGLPVFHLDQAYWQPGWVAAPPGRFRAEVERISALPAWVVGRAGWRVWRAAGDWQEPGGSAVG